MNADSPSPGRARRHGPPYSSDVTGTDSERSARLGRQRHAQSVGQPDGACRLERREVDRSVAVRSVPTPRPAGGHEARNASSSPASVPYDWTSIPVTSSTRTMMAQPLTVLFMPESAYGPTNNCIGIGDVLRRRGHRVVFAAEASWKGRLEPLGFVEDLVDLAPPPPADAPEQDAGQFWKDFIRDTSPEFRKPTIEQLATFMQPTWQALIDGARYCEPQLREIIARQRPDVIVEDNVVCVPGAA